jgi:hypothetical protein
MILGDWNVVAGDGELLGVLLRLDSLSPLFLRNRPCLSDETLKNGGVMSGRGPGKCSSVVALQVRWS